MQTITRQTRITCTCPHAHTGTVQAVLGNDQYGVAWDAMSGPLGQRRISDPTFTHTDLLVAARSADLRVIGAEK